MKPVNVEPSRFEPTVFGAMRRFRVLVVAVAVAAMVAGIGYALTRGKSYVAQASVTTPLPVSQQGQGAAQYLDSQVLLMESPGVAQRAANVANAVLHSNLLTAGDFFGARSSLRFSPPAGAPPGVYGASIITVSFKWPSARVAQVGANAAIQAYDEARSAAITAQANATVAGLNQAMDQTSNVHQRTILLTDRTQVLANEQTDLANPPTPAWAAEPLKPISGGWKTDGASGLVIGIVVGAGLAYALAVHRRGFAEQQDPATLNVQPLNGESPPSSQPPTQEPSHPPMQGPPQLPAQG